MQTHYCFLNADIALSHQYSALESGGEHFGACLIVIFDLQ